MKKFTICLSSVIFIVLITGSVQSLIADESGNNNAVSEDGDKLNIIPIARDLYEMGFNIIATIGTTKALIQNGVPVKSIFKVGEGRPNVVDGIKNDEIDIVINTPLGAQARYDEESIGQACIQKNIMVVTTLSGAEAIVRAIRVSGLTNVKSLQEYHS